MSGLQILFENKGVQYIVFSCGPGGSKEYFHEGCRAWASRQGSPNPVSTKAALLLSESFIFLPNKILLGKNFDTKIN